ncbi:MepB family protein [Maribacter arcticus]|uniref:MepB family protein n=1 Tax=Maribacter arcticus TaxID=561365 RepID=UPI003002B329
MHSSLHQIWNEVYSKCSFKITDVEYELESKEYDACRFKLYGRRVINRTAKITPKKAGQFVTFWKRDGNGPIEPFSDNDYIDFFVVTVRTDTKLGQFVFPKTTLIEKGIISTEKKEGKRAFRVYTNWDVAKNKQAERTQQLQLNYFYEINNLIDLVRVKKLYQTN